MNQLGTDLDWLSCKIRVTGNEHVGDNSLAIPHLRNESRVLHVRGGVI